MACTRPPAGLCLPVKLHRVVDGDTIEVRSPRSERLYLIRLLDCWAPERHTEAGKESTAYLESLLRDSPTLHLFIPAPDDPESWLKHVLSFARILGHIWIDDDTNASDAMVKAGFARRKKHER